MINAKPKAVADPKRKTKLDDLTSQPLSCKRLYNVFLPTGKGKPVFSTRQNVCVPCKSSQILLVAHFHFASEYDTIDTRTNVTHDRSVHDTSVSDLATLVGNVTYFTHFIRQTCPKKAVSGRFCRTHEHMTHTSLMCKALQRFFGWGSQKRCT